MVQFGNLPAPKELDVGVKIVDLTGFDLLIFDPRLLPTKSKCHSAQQRTEYIRGYRSKRTSAVL